MEALWATMTRSTRRSGLILSPSLDLFLHPIASHHVLDVFLSETKNSYAINRIS